MVGGIRVKMCQTCHKVEDLIHLVDEGETLVYCGGCYNQWMSDELGVELKELAETLVLQDSSGEWRRFEVHRRLDPVGIFLEAREADEFGYQFAVHGELGVDQETLWQQLVDKITKGISNPYIERRTFPNGQPHTSLKADRFEGRLDYSGSEGNLVVVIDGRPYSWDGVGRMMRAYEGFTIEVKLSDPTD